jgi:hypothetical protein
VVEAEVEGVRRRRGRWLLALAPVVVALVAVEIACRLRAGGDWWEEVESAQLLSQQLEYEKNSDQLRDRDYASPKPDGCVRVLFLGDSFTFGLGVPDRARIFPELLEARLDAHRPDPAVQSYEVLNGAIPALLTDAWVQIAERVAPRFEPDLVVAAFFLRDGAQIGFTRNFFGPIRDRMKQWRESSLLARASAAWRLWRGRRLALEMTAEYVEAFRRAYLGKPEETEEWARAQRNLLRLRDSFAQRGARFELVVFPVLFELGPDYPFRPVCDAVERFAKRNSIPCTSLLPALEREDASDLWVSPFDQHPNARCHRLVADALEPRLRELLAGNSRPDSSARVR